ncbi:hypothetical protein M9H77_22111 [Catharanthus roseus]|uniref:Uncharacterized protein n=1 Tax=Catharanthus roseus TaxID=4058 RepID=A0ACC0APA0_CATRO|nr:hypothetical protein M9H77_22111 [Catharanthus roseus]
MTEEAFYEREEEGNNRGYKLSSKDGEDVNAYQEKEEGGHSQFTSEGGLRTDRVTKKTFNQRENLTQEVDLETGSQLSEQVVKLVANASEGITINVDVNSINEKVKLVAGFPSPGPLASDGKSFSEALDDPKVDVEMTMSSVDNGKKGHISQPTNKGNESLQASSFSARVSSRIASKSVPRGTERRPISISEMNALFCQGSQFANAVTPRWSSARDKELENAKLQIENAPVMRNAPRVLASVFRNYSKFIKSYELMENVLKVYIYKEGEKPLFHQAHLRGIYASEGWFMKLMEKNRQFVARDARKAHLFYLPFSSLKLREALHENHFGSQKDLESHLKNYVDIISRKYRFWNRTKGADHFLVACHDWAPRFTRQIMGSCIRALCNSNIARGFKIGKDVSLPVTYIRSGENPTKDVGGNQRYDRSILAFFAGGMHGYLRPILLQHWNNKEPDMKIFGPMPRDVEGKMKYREFMKSSKYCICAKGYEVHTPRVIESIYYECVPVIISDNYVPPFFEILEWESFSVFILEKDVPNLRNILVSIPEEKYTSMQNRLKIVQQYFLWHKSPVKYDLFHMILHSIWYNRVFQVKS